MPTSNSTDSQFSVQTPGCASASHERIIRPDTDIELEENEKVLCVYWRSGSLGISVYDIGTEELLIFQSVSDLAPDFPFLQMVLLEVTPRTLVLSTKEDNNVSKVLKRYMDSNSNIVEASSYVEKSTQVSLESTRSCIKMELVQNRAFGLEQARTRLLQLRLMDGQSAAESDSLRMSSLLPQLIPNSESPCVSIQAAGALIFLLDRWRNSKNIERAMEGKRYRIRNVRTCAMSGLLRIDPDTLKGLRIFLQDSHPSAYKANFHREGFSLFEVLNKCKSSAGSSMLRSLFMRPTKDVVELERRFKAIDFLGNPANDDVLTTLCETLVKVKKINAILGKLEYCNLSIQEWNTLYQSTSSLASIVHLSQKLPQDIEIFKKLGDIGIDNDPYRVAKAIQNIVDFDKSKELEQFTVKPGIDSNLDELRKKYSELPGLLAKVNIQEAKSMPFRTECAVVYYPEIGFLLGIPQPERGVTSQGSLTIPGYQFMFTANDQAFYKSARCKELDASIGDIHVYILDLETRLCKKLCTAIQQHAVSLVSAVNGAALLDCYVSMALAAREYHLVKPTFVTRDVSKSYLRIVEGRNLLQELSVDSFVPNDTMMGDSTARVQLITGPNASGKSVYISQIGVMVFLAHIGSYVPAQEMVLTAFDGIFTRLTTTESPSTGLSSFAKDLNQVSYALRYATSESLVLIDEFGIGTPDTNGQSILAASLNHWLRLLPSSPLVVGATHFHDIRNLLHQSSSLIFKGMEFLETNEALVPLFKVIDEVRESSFPMEVAKKRGIPNDVLQRAQEIAQAIDAGSTIPSVPDESLDVSIEKYDQIVRAAFEVKEDNIGAFLAAVLESEGELFIRKSVPPTPRSASSRQQSKPSSVAWNV